MLKKIKEFVIIGLTSLILLTPAVAAADNITSGLCGGTNAATTQNATTVDQTGCVGDEGSVQNSITEIASKVVNIISIIVGVIAVIFIIYGGFKYITSGGDSGKVSEAKNALIYAIVGLLVVAIAQAIVHFVLTAGSDVDLS